MAQPPEADPAQVPSFQGRLGLERALKSLEPDLELSIGLLDFDQEFGPAELEAQMR